jgi:hypothetical protein
MQGCANQLEMLQAMGVQLQTVDDLIAEPRNPPMHVIDQTGQPYGSTRRCCNKCGIMAVPGMRYLTSTEEWQALPKDQRCDQHGPMIADTATQHDPCT